MSSSKTQEMAPLLHQNRLLVEYLSRSARATEEEVKDRCVGCGGEVHEQEVSTAGNVRTSSQIHQHYTMRRPTAILILETARLVLNVRGRESEGDDVAAELLVDVQGYSVPIITAWKQKIVCRRSGKTARALGVVQPPALFPGIENQNV